VSRRRSILGPVLRRLRSFLGDPSGSRDAAFLLLLCVAEAALFWRTRPLFFDGDAFFYAAHPLRDLSGAIHALTHVDSARQYRPLGSLTYSFVFEPLFGLHYSLYGATAVFAHLVNTVLVFWILERLLEHRVAAYAGTAFWGLNPVAIYVTHSFSFLADFSYTFFYLLAILLFLRHTRSGGGRPRKLAVLAFVLALLSKELAITLPVMLVLISLMFLREGTSREYREGAAQRLVWTLFAVLAAYLVVYASLKGGRFYDTARGLNYFPRFTPATLLAKADYVLGALYLPINETIADDSLMLWPQRLVYAAAPLVGLFLIFLLWPPAAMARRVRAGLLWALISAAPVLFLTPSEFTHNLYLPAVGLALAFGLFWQHVTSFARETKWLRPGLLHLYALAVAVFSIEVNQSIFQDYNWRPHWEEVARTWVQDTKRLFPDLQPPVQLFVLQSNEADAWSLYSGDLLKVFYGQPDLKILFDEHRQPFPLEEARQGQAVALIMLNGHVHDVTAARVKQAERELAGSLAMRLDHAKVLLISGKPLDQMRFETPSEKGVFTDRVMVGEDYRPALVTLSGTRVRFPVAVTGAGRLSFGITKRFDLGDGVVARIYFETETTRKLLYERTLNPRDVPADRRWFDETVDLRPFQGQTGTLELECHPGPRGDYVADWLAWSGLILEGAVVL
jgi:hypothetical protein